MLGKAKARARKLERERQEKLRIRAEKEKAAIDVVSTIKLIMDAYNISAMDISNNSNISNATISRMLTHNVKYPTEAMYKVKDTCIELAHKRDEKIANVKNMSIV